MALLEGCSMHTKQPAATIARANNTQRLIILAHMQHCKKTVCFGRRAPARHQSFRTILETERGDSNNVACSSPVRHANVLQCQTWAQRAGSVSPRRSPVHENPRAANRSQPSTSARTARQSQHHRVRKAFVAHDVLVDLRKRGDRLPFQRAASGVVRRCLLITCGGVMESCQRPPRAMQHASSGPPAAIRWGQ